MTKAREVGRTMRGQTCVVKACRLASLPRSRQGLRRCWMGGLLVGDARPTNRARGSA